jgi:hypothetical protein
MAFVNRAIEALTTNGVLGTLFPASLLSQGAAEGWRRKLVEDSGISLLASMGDYGLFTHALVQIACAVITKDSHNYRDLTALVAGNQTRATGDALRALRRISLPPSIPVVGDQWSVFGLTPADLKSRPTWRLRQPRVEASLRKLEEMLPRLGDLFEVRQGVQTGYNPAFLLKRAAWLALPRSERLYFRAATMTDSIKGGKVVHPYYLFFPHTPQGPQFDSERKVRKAVPTYYERYLSPNRERLISRASIKRSQREDWWGLMEPRLSWSFDQSPRIISKYFSGEGGFFADTEFATCHQRASRGFRSRL